MLYSTTASFTEAHINNVTNYRKLLAKSIEVYSVSLKVSDTDTKRDIENIIKFWKRREKCCTLFLAYIKALSPYDKKFSGFPSELESDIEMIAILCENEIKILEQQLIAIYLNPMQKLIRLQVIILRKFHVVSLVNHPKLTRKPRNLWMLLGKKMIFLL